MLPTYCLRRNYKALLLLVAGLLAGCRAERVTHNFQNLSLAGTNRTAGSLVGKPTTFITAPTAGAAKAQFSSGRIILQATEPTTLLKRTRGAATTLPAPYPTDAARSLLPIAAIKQPLGNKISLTPHVTLPAVHAEELALRTSLTWGDVLQGLGTVLAIGGVVLGFQLGGWLGLGVALLLLLVGGFIGLFGNLKNGDLP
ncbi:hypothetical protein [Hymenobacter arizonensis]|uniref:Lipoprotein n=1 Tax=Hymenobacter arizonensis TaxID=1227077 RepID=A0A1I6B4Y8_HYMAR|nr:hypothetical protein [Hymenobacter arizonensis]SFQ75847.1 hypothetical protein SAMN04515668_4157 [Hymenobacter arizonensis]